MIEVLSDEQVRRFQADGDLAGAAELRHGRRWCTVCAAGAGGGQS